MLKARVATATALLLFFSIALFGFSAAGWLVFAALVGGLCGWEWAGLMQFAARRRVLLGLAVALLCASGGWLLELHGDAPADAGLWIVHAMALLLWAVVVPLWLWHRWPLPRDFRGVLVGVWLIVPPILALMQLRAQGALLLLGVLAICWIADIAAYFSGRAFGRRKLAPTISPGKTWEGVAGALLAMLVYGVLLDLLAPAAWPLWQLIPALLLLTVLSVIGDLFESLLKRQAGIKDSSQLLPGHGGVLDRVDSLTATLPVAALLLMASGGH